MWLKCSDLGRSCHLPTTNHNFPYLRMMKQIGITGNIGSGKSTVAKVFASLGIPVYDADARAKAVMTEDVQLKAALIHLLGPESYASDQTLNRAYIASKVFNNPDLLKELNALVHPAVFRDYEHWVLGQTAPYVLKEAALLYESGSYKKLDKIIVVHCPDELRISRTMQRDAVTREAVIERLSKQMPQEEKMARADFLIDNGGNQLLIPQVLALHQVLLIR
jgi:dephospho-CoA kinase